jgi:hypothetical protein
MKLDVVCDSEGRIVSLSVPGDVGPGPSGIGRSGVVVEVDQTTYTLDVPSELAEHSLVELHERLRVEVAGEEPKLVDARP